MKQNVVIKVCMNDQKSRSKALKIAVRVPGVESAALKGQDMDEIEVVGDAMDAVKLTTSLRKNVGYAELVSVKEAPAQKDRDGGDGGDEEKGTELPLPWVQMLPRYPVYQVIERPGPDPVCSIL